MNINNDAYESHQSKGLGAFCPFSCINNSATYKTRMNYYTYAYLREDGTPYYIGKGIGKRAHSSANRRISTPPKNKILYLKQNLKEEDAFKHEKYMISIFGRKDLGTGILRNLTDGGEGASGAVRSEEFKENLRKINIGKKLSKEHIDKLRLANIGEKNPNFGKKASKYTREKMSFSQKGEKHHSSCLWSITFSNKKSLKICGLNTWCKENGYSVGNVHMVYSRKRKTHKDIIEVEKLLINNIIEEEKLKQQQNSGN